MFVDGTRSRAPPHSSRIAAPPSPGIPALCYRCNRGPRKMRKRLDDFAWSAGSHRTHPCHSPRDQSLVSRRAANRRLLGHHRPVPLRAPRRIMAWCDAAVASWSIMERLAAHQGAARSMDLAPPSAGTPSTDHLWPAALLAFATCDICILG